MAVSGAGTWGERDLLGDLAGGTLIYIYLRSIWRLLLVKGLVLWSFSSKRLLFSSAKACLRLERLVNVLLFMWESPDTLCLAGSFGSLMT